MDAFGIVYAISGLFRTLIIFAIIAFLGVGFAIYHFATVNNKRFKTTTNPAITWELKAHGHTVDTVWIYTFK